MADLCCILDNWGYDFTKKKWIERTNSDVKRMFEQGGLKLCRSEDYGKHGLNRSDIELKPITLSTKIGDLEQGDIICFGGRRDVIGRVLLEVINEGPYDNGDETFYRWFIANRQDIFDCHYNLGVHADA